MASRFLTEADKNELAKRIPTKTSELSNDSGYVTDDAIPTRTSQLTNDSKYQNESQVKAYIAEALKDVKIDVDLDDYALKEDIPTKTSELSNDSGFLTEHQDLSGYATKEELNQLSEEIADQKAFVTPEMYGAKGDGVTDDSIAIQNAMKSGKRVVGNIHSTYLIENVSVADEELLYVENCNFFVNAHEKYHRVFNIERCTNIIFKTCTFDTENTKAISSTLVNYVKDGELTSNINFIHTRMGTDLFLAENCRFINGTFTVHLQNDTTIDLHGEAYFRNCYFDGCNTSFESKGFKRTVVDGCIIHQNANSGKLSHCTYFSGYQPYAEGLVKNCEIYAVSEYPIHFYHSTHYKADIENCIIEGDEPVGVVCVSGRGSKTHMSGCKVNMPNAKLMFCTLGESEQYHTFENCNMTLYQIVNNSYNVSANMNFIGCDLTFTNQGFAGGKYNVQNCKITMANPTTIGRMFNVVKTRIENCHLISYVEKNTGQLITLNGDCDISNCLIESFAYNPVTVGINDGYDNYINHSVIKGFKDDSWLLFDEKDMNNTIYIDNYDKYLLNFGQPEHGNVIATVNGEEVESNTKHRVKTIIDLEATVNENEPNYSFSHWNNGDISTKTSVTLRNDVSMEAYLRYEDGQTYSDVDCVSWANGDAESGITVNFERSGTYTLRGKNVANCVSTNATNPSISENGGGTSLSGTDISQEIVVTQTHHEITEEYYSSHTYNGYMFFSFIKPLYGFITLSFVVDILSDPLDYGMAFVFQYPKKRGSYTQSGTYDEDTRRVTITIPFEQIYTNYIEFRLAGRSMKISDVQVEYSAQFTTYEEVYNGGTETVSDDSTTVSFSQKDGFNQIIKTSGDTGRITVTIDEHDINNYNEVDLSTLDWVSASYGWYTASLDTLVKPNLSEYVVANIQSENYEPSTWSQLKAAGIGSNKIALVGSANMLRVSSTEQPTGYLVYEKL